MRPAALLLGSLALSACANTRIFSETELSDVARSCGVAQGEVIQEPDHPRFLFLYAAEPSREQLSCVRRWSRQRRMHLALIEAIDWVEETNAQTN